MSGHPRPAAVLAAFIRRDWAIATSYRLPFALELFAIFFNLALFFYLARLIDDSSIAGREGLEQGYFSFVALGLALLRILQVGLTSFAERLRQDQTTGTFEALVATPVPRWLLILASAAYDLLRAAAFSLVLVAVAALFFGLDLDPEVVSIPVVAAALVASLALFAAVGVAVAAFTVVFKQSDVLITVVLAALTLLGGVYYPVAVLPGVVEAVAQALPFTWALDVTRAALLDGDAELGKLALLAGAAALALPLALALFDRALTRATRAGTLAQY